MAGLSSVLNRPAAVPAAAGAVAGNVNDLYAAATTGANRITAASVERQGGNAAVAAAVLAFSAVGVLVAMRVVFKGAIS